jgi:hypothetical protein
VAAGAVVERLVAGDDLVVAWLEDLDGFRVVEGAELAEAPPLATVPATVVIAALATRETPWVFKPPWGRAWRSSCAPTPTTTKTSRSQASRRL